MLKYIVKRILLAVVTIWAVARKNFDFSQLTGFFPEIRTWINFIGLKFHILQNTILPNKQTALMQSASPE